MKKILISFQPRGSIQGIEFPGSISRFFYSLNSPGGIDQGIDRFDTGVKFLGIPGARN